MVRRSPHRAASPALLTFLLTFLYASHPAKSTPAGNTAVNGGSPFLFAPFPLLFAPFCPGSWGPGVLGSWGFVRCAGAPTTPAGMQSSALIGALRFCVLGRIKQHDTLHTQTHLCCGTTHNAWLLCAKVFLNVARALVLTCAHNLFAATVARRQMLLSNHPRGLIWRTLPTNK